MEKTKPSDLPQVAVEYIDSVMKHMKYRKSVRAEVRKELLAHFTDALADCETEEEKQTAAKELIEEFGDIKLLGKLLRRAKKRCRPLWRTIVARTFQLIGICFLLLMFYIVWFFAGKPQVTTNYLAIMNQQVRPVADNSQNSWPLYKQAVENYVKYETENENSTPDLSPRTISEVSDRELRIIKQLISDNLTSFDLIRQGNQKPYYWQEYGGSNSTTGEMTELISILLPHLGDYRNIARLMCWQGLFSAEQGAYERALDHIFEVYSLGDHLRGQKTTLIEQLVAMAIESLSTNTMRMILDEYGDQMDAAVLNSARKQFISMIDDKDFKVSYESEKLFMYDEAQRCFTSSRFGKSHLYFPRISMLVDYDVEEEILGLGKQGFHFLFTHPDKEETIEQVEQLYDEMEKTAAMTPASVKRQGINPEVVSEDLLRENIFIAILMPALTKVNQIAWRNRAESESMLAILAVLQCEKEHGELPQSLDVLVEKGLLNEVPIDPFSDKPLVYRKTDDGFTLYSVGLNFIDDGGMPDDYKGKNKSPQAKKWTEKGDTVFWPVNPDNSYQ